LNIGYNSELSTEIEIGLDDMTGLNESADPQDLDYEDQQQLDYDDSVQKEVEFTGLEADGVELTEGSDALVVDDFPNISATMFSSNEVFIL